MRVAGGEETIDETLRGAVSPAPPEPGVVVVLAAEKPAALALALGRDGLTLGRSSLEGAFADDDRISRKHVRLSREAGRFRVEDLGSRNGTYVNGHKLAGAGTYDAPLLIRVGRSLLWPVEDVRPFLGSRPTADAGVPVLGGRLRRAWGEIALASKAGDTLYIRGESGSGKELAARAFHEAHFGGASDAPFVAVNCAAIPEGLAERLLFGARRGAYSGANADADGYCQAADHGTLFLDEIAELDPLVQAKLLRVLENREVLALGAARPRKVELRVCAASHKQLREQVAAGRFREDLYFRIGRPEVELPALRERVDELPWLIARELRAADARLNASVSLVEACAQRPWPGNVRELLGEIRSAAQRALAAGSVLVEREHLAAEAGAAMPAPTVPLHPAQLTRAQQPSDQEIEQALAASGGNVRGTARALGMHRNQLRRWLEKHRGANAPTARPGDS
jgi:transcriptional regulator of acetoin/glycerol metabolism